LNRAGTGEPIWSPTGLLFIALHRGVVARNIWMISKNETVRKLESALGVCISPYAKPISQTYRACVLTNACTSCWVLPGQSAILVSTKRSQAMTTPRIEMNPKVMMGKPVIRGTRIPVELILRKLGEGATEADLLDAYPRLTKADIQAVMPPHRDRL